MAAINHRASSICDAHLFTKTASIAVMIFAAAACQKRSPSPAVPEEKKALYAAASRLMSFAWSDHPGVSAEHREQVTALLSDFIRDAHVPETNRSRPDRAAALITQQQLLREARGRLKAGAESDAASKLRGLTPNCVSCHRVLNLPIDFGGSETPSGGTAESALRAAEQSFANERYDAAGKQFKTAVRAAETPAQKFAVLKVWIVNEIWAGTAFPEFGEQLTELTANIAFADAEQKSISSWQREIYELENRPVPNIHPVTQAQNMLNPVLDSQSAHGDELHIVKTAFALKLLNDSLDTIPGTDLSRKGVMLKGTAYLHLADPFFLPLAEQYLVQTVRDHSGSVEAERAYKLYEDMLESGLGSGQGLNLLPEQMKTMSELRRLANRSQ